MAVRREPGLLSAPYEILEVADGETKEIVAHRYETGDMVIHPRYPGAPAEKRIRGIRLFVDRKDKPMGPDYWDVTATTLIYDLVPKLEAWKTWPARIKVTALGVAPRKRFTVEVGMK